MLGAPTGLAQWFSTLGDHCPEKVVAEMAARLAPTGPALDVCCGVGVMTRRMIAMGRDTWAFDHNPDAVGMAKGLLMGSITQALIPTHKGGLRRVKVPFRPTTQNLHFCIAEATAPPFKPGVFAWVNINVGLDELQDSFADALVACAELVAPGGLLTVATAHAYLNQQEENAHPPEEDLLEAISATGFQVLEQQDRIPQVLRSYERSFTVRFLHCIAARRS